MTYRNDHDAALARVDALEQEVSQMKKEAALRVVSLPKPPPIRRGVAALGKGFAILAMGGVFGAALAADQYAPQEPTPARALATLDTRLSRAALEACIDMIDRLPPTLAQEVVLTPGNVKAVEATAAPCRLEIRDIQRAGLWSPTERDALGKWADAEDALANRIAMIGVYHGNDPITLDAGKTAGQLWSEYARAHALRDAAIAAWRGTY